MKKICVVTGTRAEYGLLKWVMEGIKNSKKLQLQLIVTGMHLSHEFGYTISTIKSDGFKIDHKVEMLLSSDSTTAISKSIGLGIIGFADALSQLKPDFLLVLGDRFEIFSAATAAMISRIPIIHIHGGELTEGLIDDPIRHSISKMSYLHFVACEEYKRRVIQLGEQPDNVFDIGGLGVESILRLKLLSRSKLEKEIGFKFLPSNFLITFHPVTLEKNTASYQMDQLLKALSELKNTGLIFTMPNADTEGRVIFEKILNFCKQHSTAKAFVSLGQLKYLSCIQYIDAVIGNSSSGLIEVPTFKKATVNIGDRQRGRLKALSVVDCEAKKVSIRNAIKYIYSSDFQSKLPFVKNPYGTGGASKKIIQILENNVTKNMLKKKFYDMPSL